MKELAGRRALVTGAGRGIGAGIAEALADAGAEVLLHYRTDPARAEAVAGDITARGGKAYPFQAALDRPEGVEALFAEVDRRWGGLDLAVNNAGWDPGDLPWEAIDYENYERLTGVNVRGTLFCCLRAMERMRRNPDGGAIVNIGSVHMHTTVPGRVLYALSKGAIHAMTGALALEGGPLAIRVNAVAPGYIAVERLRDRPDFDEAAVAAGIPVGRLGAPRDVGELVVFLASPRASFITGQTIIADGGVNRLLARRNHCFASTLGDPERA